MQNQLENGKLEYSKGNYLQAVHYFDEANSISPSKETHFNLAKAYGKLKKYREAALEAKKALECMSQQEDDREKLDILLFIGNNEINAGSVSTAVKYFEQIRTIGDDILTQQEKNQIDCFLSQAQHENNGKMKSKECFKKAEQMVNMQKYGEAIELFAKSAEAMPNANTYCQIGECHYKLNQFKEAIKAFRKSISAWKQETKSSVQLYLPYFYIGKCYLEQGKSLLAKESLYQASDITPNSSPEHKKIINECYEIAKIHYEVRRFIILNFRNI